MRRRRFTMAEVMIALALMLLLLTMVVRTTLMGWSSMREGHAQLAYQASARFAGEKISRDVQNARSISILSGGTRLYLLNEDNSIREFRYEDDDDNDVTVDDNRIVLDAEGEGRVLISNVSPVGITPVFAPSGKGVAVTFNVGDPVASATNDRMSGNGYQGLTVRLVAKPRNVGHVWTLNQDL